MPSLDTVPEALCRVPWPSLITETKIVSGTTERKRYLGSEERLLNVKIKVFAEGG